jgi:Ni,Fe-hydrogenase I large subunit
MNSSKVGFGYCGFDSSITAVIPKHEIIRPTEVHRIKKIHPQNWNSSPKIPTGKAAVIKPLPGTKKSLDELKPKPFRAKPVPRSHYNEPYRPELPSKKDRQPKIAAAKKVDTAHPGLASRIWNKIVDPILHSNDNVEETGIAQGKLVEKVITAEVSPEAGHTPLIDDASEKVEMSTRSLRTQVTWHSPSL